MRNAGLVEPQAEIKTAGRNINNLRYAEDTTFMAESVLPMFSCRNFIDSGLMFRFLVNFEFILCMEKL